MADKNILLHPYNTDGTQDSNTNLYPKTKAENVEGLPEGDTDIEFVGDSNNVLQEVTVGDETYTVPQGSAITVDQIFNPISVNPQSGTAVAGAISGKQDNKPNGTDNLIVNNKVNTAYIPDGLLGQVKYMGTWNANQSTPVTTSPTKGDYYICTAAGEYLPTGASLSYGFQVGDWAIYNGSTAGWSKVDNTDAVTMVNGQIGSIQTYKGTWTTSTTYYAGDFVKDSTGTVYLCIATNTGAVLTNTTYWHSFANKPDQTYNAQSTNAQSGVAVAEGIAVETSRASAAETELASTKLNASPNGTTPLLDNNNKINFVYLSDTIIGQVLYKGTWDATSSTGVATSPVKGDYYICTVAGNRLPTGTIPSPQIIFEVGDWAIYNGESAGWSKVDNTDAVTLVNNQKGSVQTYKELWLANTTYYAGDFVKDSNGTIYLCLLVNTNRPLTETTYWHSFEIPEGDTDIEFTGSNGKLESVTVGNQTFTVGSGAYKITAVTETADSINVTLEVV